MVQSQWHPENWQASIVKSQHKDEWINILKNKIKVNSNFLFLFLFHKNNNFDMVVIKNFNIKVTGWKIYISIN